VLPQGKVTSYFHYIGPQRFCQAIIPIEIFLLIVLLGAVIIGAFWVLTSMC
jgi:hypothetical protein